MTVDRGWETAERILAVRLDAMGDVVMTTPALRAIRAARPNAHLALLTSPAGAAVASLVDEVDEVIEYEAPWLKPVPSDGVDAARDLAFIEDLCRPSLRCRRRLHGPLAERPARGAGLSSRADPAAARPLPGEPVPPAHRLGPRPRAGRADPSRGPAPARPRRIGRLSDRRGPPLDPCPAPRRSPDAGVGTRRRPRRRAAVAGRPIPARARHRGAIRPPGTRGHSAASPARTDGASC